MSDDDEVGYRKPPKHTRFKKDCVSPNPKGRPRKVGSNLGDLVDLAINSAAQYRENGVVKTTSLQRVAVMKHITNAVKGNVKSAVALLDQRAHALKHGETNGTIVIEIRGGLPKKDK
jgi:hypothetical protein